jgi:phenylpyruvate tautomerase PptA (4-oxalocrotonate tautomerase family)
VPIYEVIATHGTLSPEVKAEIARAITTIHAQETGAPGHFIHVYFPELPGGSLFTAGEQSSTVIVRALVRAGRPDQVREAILKRTSDMLQEVADVSAMETLVTVIDVPPSWAIEAGILLPEPTKEAEDAWFAEVSGR